MRSTRLAALLLALALGSVAPATAELYRWTDAQGQMHVTMHLDQVPPRYRPAAMQAAQQDKAAPSLLQSYATPDDGAPRARRKPNAVATEEPAARVYHVRVARAPIGMIVQVRLNDRVTAPFLIDTGATDVLLPKQVAAELGLDVGPDTRTMQYQTANGVVEHPVLMLDSVEVGGARVEQVPASVGSMELGLLGLSFFNHFTYRVDAAAGIVTLSPNGLAAAGLIRGGRSAAQWRSQFENLRVRLAQAGGGRDAEALRHQLELLEDEADEADVPSTWRD